MGAASCVAARDKTIPSVSSGEYRNRNARYSPTWSFRWENRGRVVGEDASVIWLSDGVNSHHNGIDSKLGMTRESNDQSITRVVSTDSHQAESQESLANQSQSSVTSTSSPAHFQHASSTPSRLSNHSRKLLQQVPGSMTCYSKSPRSPSATAERLPIPSWSNESKQGSLCGISDVCSENALTKVLISSLGRLFRW